MKTTNENWSSCNTQIFWGEVAPCDHVVQIYKTDDVFLKTLEEFVTCGIYANDCVIVIGTVSHLIALEKKLRAKGINIDALADDDQLILLNAELTLSKFVKNGLPDEVLFTKVVTKLIAKAKKKNRKVRAFGEMVAILWSQGHGEATIKLENMWNKFCETEAFCLFCAYPSRGFTQDAVHSIASICKTHTKMIDGVNRSKTEVYYKNT